MTDERLVANLAEVLEVRPRQLMGLDCVVPDLRVLSLAATAEELR